MPTGDKKPQRVYLAMTTVENQEVDASSIPSHMLNNIISADEAPEIIEVL